MSAKKGSKKSQRSRRARRRRGTSSARPASAAGQSGSAALATAAKVDAPAFSDEEEAFFASEVQTGEEYEEQAGPAGWRRLGGLLDRLRDRLEAAAISGEPAPAPAPAAAGRPRGKRPAKVSMTDQGPLSTKTAGPGWPPW